MNARLDPVAPAQACEITSADIVARASHAAFGKPLITNVLRAMLVEAMVDAALPSGWHWCAADYASWDFEHTDGTRLEVKQSAARQSWATATSLPSACSWDIAARTKFWSGSEWIPVSNRSAHIYVLGHHPVADDSADHRDPDQWKFFVVSAAALPATKRIALNRVQGLAAGINFSELVAQVEGIRARLHEDGALPWPRAQIPRDA